MQWNDLSKPGFGSYNNKIQTLYFSIKMQYNVINIEQPTHFVKIDKFCYKEFHEIDCTNMYFVCKLLDYD